MTRAEVKRVLQRLDGVNRVMGMLLYGSGMRLLECLLLRVNPGPRLELSWPPFA
jgi:integrase